MLLNVLRGDRSVCPLTTKLQFASVAVCGNSRFRFANVLIATARSGGGCVRGACLPLLLVLAGERAGVEVADVVGPGAVRGPVTPAGGPDPARTEATRAVGVGPVLPGRDDLEPLHVQELAALLVG